MGGPARRKPVMANERHPRGAPQDAASGADKGADGVERACAEGRGRGDARTGVGDR